MDEQAMQQIVQALINIGVPQENAMQIAQALGQAQNEQQMMQILQQSGLNEQQIQQLGAQLQGGQPQGMPKQQAMSPEQAMQGQEPMMDQKGQMPQDMAGVPQQFAYGGRYYKRPVNAMQEQLSHKPFIVIEPGNFEGKTRYRKGGLKKNVSTYKNGGDFPPSMLNNDVNGGDRMAMEYMDRQRSPQPQTQAQINNEARAIQNNEAPFVASDGSTWQFNGSEYVKIADADQSKAYDPTMSSAIDSGSTTQSKVVEPEGAAAQRYRDYVKSTYKDNAKIYGSDIEGKNEMYEARKANNPSMKKPVEFMPKYAYESLPASMKKEADKKLEKGLLQITGEDINNYVEPVKIVANPTTNKPTAKQQEVKAIKEANKEKPKISTPAARVEYKRPEVSDEDNIQEEIVDINDFKNYWRDYDERLKREEEQRLSDSLASAKSDSLNNKAYENKKNNVDKFVNDYKEFIFGSPINANKKSIEYGKSKGVFSGANEGYSIGDKLSKTELQLQSLAKRRGLDLVVTPSKVYEKYSGIFSPSVKPKNSEYKYYIGREGFNDLEDVYKYIMYKKR